MGMFSGDFYADSLRMTTHLNVIFPDPSNDVTPVISGTPRLLYLLHGLSGNSAEWTRFSKIEYYAKKYNFIIVMPEVQRSFYCDYPSGPRYFTYVADELPQLCRKWFQLDSRRENTYIAGESMGGYGAFKAALLRPGQFAAAASLSGALDYRSLARMVLSGQWTDMCPEEFYALHGPSGVPAESDDLLTAVERAAKDPNRPRLIQLCGTEDFLYESNQVFRRAAERAGYGLTYREGPGDHEWPYWDKAIQYAFHFFCGLDSDTTPIY